MGAYHTTMAKCIISPAVCHLSSHQLLVRTYISHGQGLVAAPCHSMCRHIPMGRRVAVLPVPPGAGHLGGRFDV